METQTLSNNTEKIGSYPQLHELVNSVSSRFTPTISTSKNVIINHVPGEICIRNHEEKIKSLINDLMGLVINHTENNHVRITAKLFGNVVLMHVKDDGSLNYDSISGSLVKIQSLAEQLGGFVGFTSYRNKLTTIAFSFMNVSAAA